MFRLNKFLESVEQGFYKAREPVEVTELKKMVKENREAQSSLEYCIKFLDIARDPRLSGALKAAIKHEYEGDPVRGEKEFYPTYIKENPCTAESRIIVGEIKRLVNAGPTFVVSKLYDQIIGNDLAWEPRKPWWTENNHALVNNMTYKGLRFKILNQVENENTQCEKEGPDAAVIASTSKVEEGNKVEKDKLESSTAERLKVDEAKVKEEARAAELERKKEDMKAKRTEAIKNVAEAEAKLEVVKREENLKVKEAEKAVVAAEKEASECLAVLEEGKDIEENKLDNIISELELRGRELEGAKNLEIERITKAEKIVTEAKNKLAEAETELAALNEESSLRGELPLGSSNEVVLSTTSKEYDEYGSDIEVIQEEDCVLVGNTNTSIE